MNVEAIREFGLSLKGTTEDMPFGEGTLVLRVMGKIFTLISLDTETARANLKCDPERAIELREQYPESITPGFHMNKQHWNTVQFEADLDDRLLRELIVHSYETVIKTLKKTEREALANL
jgi:predicted DNA-binding protein (MmcQ/YjbR family)